MRHSVVKVGVSRKRPRIWLEGRYLKNLGFTPGKRISATFAQGEITITPADDGRRTVSVRRGKSIIDLNTADITTAIGAAGRVTVECETGKITITPAEVDVRRLARKADRTCGSLFSGGGLLDEAARQAGYSSAFGLELSNAYADVWQQNHAGRMFCGSVADLPLARLPQVDLLVGGIPCEPFSTKRGFNAVEPAQHPLADMTCWTLLAVYHANPRNLVIEESPGYLASPVAAVFLTTLRRMGYTADARVISGTDYGSLCVRKRAVIVARTAPGPFPWPAPTPTPRTLADVLLPADDARCEWFTRDTKSWLFEHWDRQRVLGRFLSASPRVLRPDETAVPSISKRYFAGQGDCPVVAHPSAPETYRWLTLGEVKVLHGLPADYYLGESKTRAGEIVGQGVLVDVFAKIIRAVA